MFSTPEEFNHLPTVDEEPADMPDASGKKPGGLKQPASETPATKTTEPAAVEKEITDLPAKPTPSKDAGPGRVTLQRPMQNKKTAPVSIKAPPPLAASVPGQIAPAAPSSPPPQRLPAVKNKPTERISTAAGVKAGPPKTRPIPVLPARAKIPSGETHAGESPPADTWRERWDKWGWRSLALSVGIHVLLLGTGTLIVVHQVMDRQVDFLPGGGSAQGAQAEQALQHKIQQKKNPWLKKSMPIRKLTVADSMKSVVLPTEAPDMLDIPQASKPLGGGMFSGGFGLAGAAGGFGNGVGLGAKSGMTFGPLFGLNIKAKKLAVVLDVSTSMTPQLERVVKEVDKVAKGSVVVLYFGCGLETPPKALVGTKVFRTSAIEFEKFWRLGGATYMETAEYKIKTKDPIPNKDLFLQLSRRPQTYFIHNVGVGYTWLALLSDEVRNADGLYWFSDFQDSVDFKQIGIVLDNLKRRKQRLYIHSYGKGPSFDLIKNQLVVPTEGDSYIEE